MTAKRITNVIGVLMVLAFLSMAVYKLFNSNDQPTLCQWQKDFNKHRFYGVVAVKFYDHANHSTPTVILKNIDKMTMDTIDFLGDSSMVFDNLKKFDTVCKNANTSTVFIRLNGHLKKIGDVVFGCKLNPNH